MVTVKVCWKSTGKSAKGKDVVISFDGLMRGVTRKVLTDSNGEAHFDADPGTGKVIVDGERAFSGRIEGRVMVYV